MATKTPANVLKMATTQATHGLSPFQLEVRKTYSRSNCKELWLAPLEHAYKNNEKCELGLALSANAPPEHADRYNANFARGKDDFPKVLFFFEPATRRGARMKWGAY